jgi:hypothetical protein
MYNIVKRHSVKYALVTSSDIATQMFRLEQEESIDVNIMHHGKEKIHLDGMYDHLNLMQKLCVQVEKSTTDKLDTDLL